MKTQIVFPAVAGFGSTILFLNGRGLSLSDSAAVAFLLLMVAAVWYMRRAEPTQAQVIDTTAADMLTAGNGTPQPTTQDASWLIHALVYTHNLRYGTAEKDGDTMAFTYRYNGVDVLRITESGLQVRNIAGNWTKRTDDLNKIDALLGVTMRAAKMWQAQGQHNNK